MNPAELQYSPNKNVQLVVHHPDGRVWSFESDAWVTFSAGDWVDYQYDLNEQNGTGYYRRAYPLTEVQLAGVLPTEAYYERLGSTAILPGADGGDIPIGTSQALGVDVFALHESTEAARLLAASAGTMETGTVQSGANTDQQMVTDLTAGEDNAYRGRVVIFTTGDNQRVAAIVTGFIVSTGILSFTQIPSAAGVGDEFVLV